MNSSPDEAQTPYGTVAFVGDHPLVASCAGRLIDAGLRVVAISSDDDAIGAWADDAGIDRVAWDDFGAYLERTRPDLLLSVGNLRIIGDDMIASVGLAVNFHDGPLPAYAGLHTPMWAILAGETEYAVSWHVVESGVDEGDVLAASSFAVSADETTRSINLKCFAAAGDSFERLVEQLVDGSLDRTPQVGSGRYCGRYERPVPAGALVPHSMAAAEIDRLVRALDFGPTINRVGRPLLQLDDTTLLLVGSCEMADAHRSEAHTPVAGSPALPGTVIDIDRAGRRMTVTVATTTVPVRLSGWVRDDAPASVTVGSVLPDPSALLDTLAAVQEATVRNERWWSRRLDVVDVAFAPVDPTLALVSTETVCVADASRAEAIAALFALARSDAATGTVDVRTDTGHGTELSPWFRTLVPATVSAAPDAPVGRSIAEVAATIAEARRRGPILADLAQRMPVQVDGPPDAPRPSIAIVGPGDRCDAPVQFVVDGGDITLQVRAEPATAAALREGLAAFVAAIDAAGVDTVTGSLPVVGAAAAADLVDLGGRADASAFAGGLHERFAAVAATQPDTVAVVHRGRELTYGELDRRARRIGARLVEAGVAPGDLVGVATAPGIDMVTGVLGVLMAGAAYVPLDPRFPRERLAFMAEDAAMAVIVTDDAAHLPVRGPVAVDIAAVAADPTGAELVELVAVGPDALAYVMYTSGSTGRPKGVMVEHGNVDSFLRAMEPHLGTDDGVWLSVTTLSFDISVLELFHPLVHGWKVVLYEGLAAMRPKAPGRGSTRLDMSLFFFGSEGAEGGGEYEVLFDAARFADERGFVAVWTPERHFNAFGGPFPNPSVTSAALAAITENVSLRAGSCVLPLHHPARVAEEWAVVDRISGGRTGMAIAAGWHPHDFVFRPQNHGQPKSALIEQIGELRALWRGETVTYPGPTGDVEVTTLPRPIQADLPLWYTTAGNIESFRLAGREGYNLLTHLLGQSVDEVREKVAAYRAAWDEAGHPGRGTVSLMLHTFVADDNVRETVREPMKGYLRDSVMLVKDHASAFPTFDPTATESDGLLMGLTPEDLDALLEVAFARYFETSGLFGDVETCVAMAEEIAGADVDEIAALVDFGIDAETVLAQLHQLDDVRRHFLVDSAVPDTIETYASLIEAHGVTHLQCTPSEARIILADPASHEALGRLHTMLVGGEACPMSVARDLVANVGGTVVNVYGPTETTIWSTAHVVTADDLDGSGLPIGQALANTFVRVAGPGGALRPGGAIGELLIGGLGVTRGYHRRPELTAERFVTIDGERLYRTGDLVRWRSDGILEFLGRADSQVKLRGHRIELGEIEAALEGRDDVAEAVVVVHGEGDDARLVGHLVPVDAERHAETAALVGGLRTVLPSHMVPEKYRWHATLPTTPNGKVDRLALAAMDLGGGAAEAPVEAAPQRQRPSAPATARPMDSAELAGLIETAWRDTLKTDTIDRNRTFFDHGGNSLQVVTLREALENKLARTISLVDLFRYPTVNELADAFAAEAAPAEEPVAAGGATGAGRPVVASDRAGRRAAARRAGRRGRP
ncbi:MAG: MupA/Atu3671 family FMN-dependent luciferase-like monooxygenase [Acidimicrobiales bacterium]